jgi:hypothetical protein
MYVCKELKILRMKRITLLILCVLVLTGTANARRVTGEVSCEGKGISKVVVTDGETFTTTAGNGKFTFNINDEAEFIYIITPSGYVADWSKGAPEFYKKAKGSDFFSFELAKTGNGKKEYNIIAVSDPQPRSGEHFNELIGKPLEDIRGTVASLRGQSVGVALGDICFDVLPLMERWKQGIVHAGVPFYAVIGNHDHDREFNDDKLAAHEYRRLFGPENYAFFLGSDLVIVLDNIIYHSRSGYEEGYTDEIISWVEGLMEYVPKKATIYLAQHASLNVPEQKNVNKANNEKMLKILKGHKVNIISGHTHINGNFQCTPTVAEHNVATVCGTWWDTYHCNDGTPRGYKVFNKKNGKLTWYYKSVGKDPDFQYEIFVPGEAPLHPEHVVLNVWDCDHKWKIEWFEDGKRMGQMEQVSELSPIHIAELNAKYAPTGTKPKSYRRTIKATHYFAAKPSDGTKEITVVITNRFGKVWKETIHLKK